VTEFGVPVAPVRLSAAAGPADLLLVDRVGVLAALYGAGQMAYVGGGYRSAGLHSVLEPAAWGLPVLMGPRWTESRDAVLLREAGAAVPLPAVGGAEDPVALIHRTWSGWITDAASRTKAGAAGRATVEAGLGASARSVAVIARSLGQR
jgi:3-deoxy-D-manno-octulosonic-acid transferase